jgi:hypothetical protein
MAMHWLWLYMPCHDHVMPGTGQVHDWFYPPFTDDAEGVEDYLYGWLFPTFKPRA